MNNLQTKGIRNYKPRFYTNVGFANINGLKSKLEELKDFINEQNLDVMLVNETHLRPCQNAKIQNYNFFRKDRLINKGGGVAIYTKRSIKCTEFILPTLDTIEAVAVVLENEDFGEVLFISVYNPPNSILGQKDMTALLTTGLPTVLAGDLNAKNTIWGCRANNKNGIALRKFILDQGVTLCAPDEPTHYPGTLNHRPDILDIMLIKGIPSTPTLKVHSCLSSDHTPVTFTFYGLTQPPEVAKFKTDWEKFHSISGENLIVNPQLRSINQIDEAIEKLTLKLKRDIDICSKPLNLEKTYKLPDEIKDEIREKNKLRKVYQTTRHPQAKSKWNEACRKVSSLIKEYKQTNWEDTVMRLSTHDNTVWKMAKALKSKQHNIGPLQGPNSIVYTEKDMAEVLATSLHNQFSPHPTPINLEHVDLTISEVDNYLAQEPNNIIRYTTPEEITNIIKTLDPKKASGYDLISNKALKSSSHKVIVHINNIFNACLRIKYFPTKWKKAIVILFKKPGKSPLQPSNYRPISLLPCLAKVFEKVINLRLNSFLDENKTINLNQYGFKKGHSTTHQVHRIVETIGEAFNNKEMIGAVFLDVEKAFDSLWHEGLIKKLITQNIPKEMIHLIHSFLTDRCFQVRVNNTLSTLTTIKAGVPQGSILGPILFNLYINDFPTLDNCITAQFADDTAILAKSKHGDLAFEKLQTALDTVQTWCEDWRIKINAQKSVSVLFRRHDTLINYDTDLEIFDTEIKNEKHTKYLGVHLDWKLNFNEHIKQTLAKATGASISLNPLIGRNSKMSLNNKLLLYKSMIRPILLYASPAWAAVRRTTRNKLQIFQNKSLRRLTDAIRYVRNDTLHRDLKIDTIDTAILTASHNYNRAIENSNFPNLKEIINYDQTVNQKYKRPRTIHHDPTW